MILIVDDPDASVGLWVHWIVFNIPIIDKIQENSVPGKQGVNSWGRNDYGGPCPPSGTHRYFFKLYALDKKLDIKKGINKNELENIMHGHILAESLLIGLYRKY